MCMCVHICRCPCAVTPLGQNFMANQHWIIKSALRANQYIPFILVTIFALIHLQMTYVFLQSHSNSSLYSVCGYRNTTFSFTINSYDQDVFYSILWNSFLNLKAELYNYRIQFHWGLGLLFQPTEIYLHLDFSVLKQLFLTALWNV